MRVALIDPSLFTLPYDAALARGLAEAGHQATLHGRRPDRDDGVLPGGVTLVPGFYRIAGSPALAALPNLLRLPVKGLDHAASLVGLLRRLRRAPPDVIHFQWLPLPVVDRRVLGAFRALAPLVLTVHDTNPFNGDPSGKLQRLGFLRCLDRFDRLIVHTEQGRGRLASRGIAPDRIAVLPHGMLAEPAPPGPAGDPAAPLTFLLFGKLKPYKGIDLLIEAFACLPAALRAQARLRVVGKPYMDLAPLRALAQARGIAPQVRIEPRFVADDEIPALFGPNTIAVFPYREIEASGAMFLALAHGRPVIASRLGSFAELLEDGVHGHLIPPEDAPALATALRHAAADRDFVEACAANVRRLAESIPPWHEIGRHTAAIYREARSCRAEAFQAAPAPVRAAEDKVEPHPR